MGEKWDHFRANRSRDSLLWEKSNEKCLDRQQQRGPVSVLEWGVISRISYGTRPALLMAAVVVSVECALASDVRHAHHPSKGWRPTPLLRTRSAEAGFDPQRPIAPSEFCKRKAIVRSGPSQDEICHPTLGAVATKESQRVRRNRGVGLCSALLRGGLRFRASTQTLRRRRSPAPATMSTSCESSTAGRQPRPRHRLCMAFPWFCRTPSSHP